MVSTYLDWLTALPWHDETEDVLDIGEARKVLDEDHYGLDKPKRRIVEVCLNVAEFDEGVFGAAAAAPSAPSAPRLVIPVIVSLPCLARVLALLRCDEDIDIANSLDPASQRAGGLDSVNAG